MPKKKKWDDNYMCIYCMVEGLPKTKKMVQFKPKGLSWDKFILILEEQLKMEDIEGIYALEGGLQMWRVEAIVNCGEDSEFFVRFSERAALLRALAAEGDITKSAPETKASTFQEVKRATHAKEHLQTEIEVGWPEMSPYTGPMFDLDNKKALQTLCGKELDPMVITRTLLGMLDYPEPLAYGMRMLGNFAVQSDKSKEIIVENKGVNVAVASMDQFRAHAKLQIGGCILLANLSFAPNLRECISDEGGVESLLEAMRHYRADEKIQLACCQGLYNLAMQADGAESMVDSGGILDILLAMRNLPNEQLVHRFCCFILTELVLCKEHDLKTPMLDEELQTVNTVQATYSRFYDHEDVKQAAESLLTLLGEDMEQTVFTYEEKQRRRGIAIGAL
jgi:hypothetical protein